MVRIQAKNRIQDWVFVNFIGATERYWKKEKEIIKNLFFLPFICLLRKSQYSISKRPNLGLIQSTVWHFKGPPCQSYKNEKWPYYLNGISFQNGCIQCIEYFWPQLTSINAVNCKVILNSLEDNVPDNFLLENYGFFSSV